MRSHCTVCAGAPSCIRAQPLVSRLHAARQAHSCSPCPAVCAPGNRWFASRVPAPTPEAKLPQRPSSWAGATTRARLCTPWRPSHRRTSCRWQKAKNEPKGKADATSASTGRCCAERRLLQSWEDQARRHGVRPARMATWIRRKMGGHLLIWRCLCDGSFGCAAPCVFCVKTLAVYDFQIHCPLSASEWWHGRLSDAMAPPAKLTYAQRQAVKNNCEGPDNAKQKAPLLPERRSTASPRRGKP